MVMCYESINLVCTELRFLPLCTEKSDFSRQSFVFAAFILLPQILAERHFSTPEIQLEKGLSHAYCKKTLFDY